MSIKERGGGQNRITNRNKHSLNEIRTFTRAIAVPNNNSARVSSFRDWSYIHSRLFFFPAILLFCKFFTKL